MSMVWPTLGSRTAKEQNRTAAYYLLLLLHPFNGLFFRTTWVNRYHKGKISLDLTESRDDGVLGWQWHQLDHMQTICTSLQIDNHTNTSSLNIYRAMLCIAVLAMGLCLSVCLSQVSVLSKRLNESSWFLAC